MKEFFKKAGIPVAPFHVVDTEENCLRFAHEVGYPIVAKPDNGVGAMQTFKLTNDQELREFFIMKWPETVYIMEQFVNGEVNSYDAILDSNGEPMFETGNVTPMSIMDIVNNNDNSIFYILKKLPDDTRQAGRAVAKAFDVRSRFVHFEFFRLNQDQKNLGKKGDLVALEVNMRPSGGVTPDMIDFAYDTDVYKIWADMIAFDRSTMPVGKGAYCAFAGRRDGKDFVMTHQDIMEKYGDNMKLVERLPEVLSSAMGNQLYVATFSSQKKMDEFYKDILKCK